ncbi:MAG: CDGSH iron-sulfur domain-containing protein [Thermoplasmata archaeon]|nr:CDGSH iron-sulfur domain-containing protein [Thermoplasmata archaeon]MCI4333058.1 CDGSH iron-sulfur domain-containing protein [Thermoplasmata archaeon]
MKIVVTKNGPYLVTGNVPLRLMTIRPNAAGESWDWEEGRVLPAGRQYELCRCGQSKTKPFCDRSHERVRFDGTETASRRPFARQAGVLEGPTLVLQDAENLCAFARFCDPAGKIWALVPQSADPNARALAIREAMACPSGRLVVRDKATGQEMEPNLPPSIGIVEDTALQCSGPLWVRGGVQIESEGGAAYEVRNRVTLCRCGASNNKPFCNGSHANVPFRDGLV